MSRSSEKRVDGRFQESAIRNTLSANDETPKSSRLTSRSAAAFQKYPALRTHARSLAEELDEVAHSQAALSRRYSSVDRPFSPFDHSTPSQYHFQNEDSALEDDDEDDDDDSMGPSTPRQYGHLVYLDDVPDSNLQKRSIQPDHEPINYSQEHRRSSHSVWMADQIEYPSSSDYSNAPSPPRWEHTYHHGNNSIPLPGHSSTAPNRTTSFVSVLDPSLQNSPLPPKEAFNTNLRSDASSLIRVQPSAPLPVPLKIACKRFDATITRERGQRERDDLSSTVEPSSRFIGFFTPFVMSMSSRLEAGISEESYADMVDWILNVIPSEPVTEPCFLFPHLQSSFQTRLHAVQLFARYVHRVGLFRLNLRSGTSRERRLIRVREQILWETALGCLVIAVKMNHDFLLPLYPVHSEAFHTLGPVSEDMTFEELEGAQRDILGTLEFDVYDVTPQLLMHDLVYAVPSLDAIVRLELILLRDIQEDLRTTMVVVVKDRSVLRFPMSLLTAVIVHGFVSTYLLDINEVREVNEYLQKPTMSDSGIDVPTTCHGQCSEYIYDVDSDSPCASPTCPYSSFEFQPDHPSYPYQQASALRSSFIYNSSTKAARDQHSTDTQNLLKLLSKELKDVLDISELDWTECYAWVLERMIAEKETY